MVIDTIECLGQINSSPILFQYLNIRVISSFIMSLVIMLVSGPIVIRRLIFKRISQVVRDDGPKSHLSKLGTPTMGGAPILVSIVISTLLWANMLNQYVWLLIFVTLSFGVIGFVDDYIKLVSQNSRGLLGRHKYMWQSLIGASLSVFICQTSVVPAETQLMLPFFKNIIIPLGNWYIFLSYLIIVGSSNAVNLTDGLDGLTIMPILMVTSALGLFSYSTGHYEFSNYFVISFIPGAGEITVFCASVVGASLGFLWFNTYPAQVFMGDIGALSLGASLGAVAVFVGQELIFTIMGGVFVIEASSVILQVILYKHRFKRVLLMAPIHHHYELMGCPEPRIIVRFWIVTVLLVLLGLFSLRI